MSTVVQLFAVHLRLRQTSTSSGQPSWQRGRIQTTVIIHGSRIVARHDAIPVGCFGIPTVIANATVALLRVRRRRDKRHAKSEDE
jgi:hypothetical protein